MDFAADVYQEKVRLFFLKRLREEQTFDSTTQLMTQIRKDVKAARGALVSQFPWLEESLKTLLNTPVALQLLGQIAARSM